MVVNFHNLAKEIASQVQEAQSVSDKMNPKRPTARHAIIEMSKVKEKILKSAREK